MEINSENHANNGLISSSLKQDNEVAVVIVPLQAQGHLNQLLQFACLVSSYGLTVYYVGLANYNHQARVRANALSPSDIAKIHFHDLPSSRGGKIPRIWDACMLLREPIASFFQDISSKARRVVVVHDLLMSYSVQDVSSFPNAESYVFNCVSSFDMYCSHICKATGLPVPLEAGQVKRMPSLEGCYPDEIVHVGRLQSSYTRVKAGDIYNTSQVIEGSTYLDLMEKIAGIQNKKQWAIGPILPTKGLDHISNRDNICLDWLNKQPPNSILYVSFGTSTSFSDEQIKELAMGLEKSKQKFIWVVRGADEGVLFSGDGRARRVELPEGFEERAEGVGLVVRDWAPQPEILAHSSTGGFMSHCGWNSCLESITMGVPIAAWPMQFDQPKNGFLVTQIMKTGLVVRECKKREELVTASTIENVMRKLMASEEGDIIRKRAEELGEGLRRSTEKGGASRMELESFIAHITR